MKEPVFLTLDEVLRIHSEQIFLHGGADGVRSQELLESAVMQPQASFGGVYAHKNIYEMAAAYLFHICQNHPFIDGNKRTALETCDEDEVADFVLKIAAGDAKKPEITRFLKQFAKKVK